MASSAQSPGPAKSEAFRPIITLEEHFLSRAAEAQPNSRNASFRAIPGLFEQFTELGPKRIGDMDAGQVTMQVISHGPGDLSPAKCRECNDQLAEAVRSHPDRFAGFAELAMDEPQEAAKELRRTCSGENGGIKFVGALVDSHTESGLYYDGPEFDVLWAEAEKLDVPIYIHPTWPSDQLFNANKSPHLSDEVTMSIMAFGFGWHSDVAVHILRLYAGGIFDRFPKLKIVIASVFTMVKAEICPRGMGQQLVADDERELGARPAGLHSPEYEARQNHVQCGLSIREEPRRIEMVEGAGGERYGDWRVTARATPVPGDLRLVRYPTVRAATTRATTYDATVSADCFTLTPGQPTPIAVSYVSATCRTDRHYPETTWYYTVTSGHIESWIVDTTYTADSTYTSTIAATSFVTCDEVLDYENTDTYDTVTPLTWASLALTFATIQLTWWVFDLALVFKWRAKSGGLVMVLDAISWNCVPPHGPASVGVIAASKGIDSSEFARIYYLGMRREAKPPDRTTRKLIISVGSDW
ncbi:2-amino-3-carboxymuconate-6-semialdehyde decarboxylase [Seiridium cupressi]